VSSVRRIIIGASSSPGSLRALRHAQHLARDLDATLVPVLSWLPPGGDLADRRTPCEELRRIWAQDARQRLQDALQTRTCRHRNLPNRQPHRTGNPCATTRPAATNSRYRSTSRSPSR
jgi:hypothetical protein